MEDKNTEDIAEELSEQVQEQLTEERLEKRRAWLRSLSQEDRDFIAKYGEENWRKTTRLK